MRRSKFLEPVHAHRPASSSGLNHASDCPDDAFELGYFQSQLLAAGGGELVVARAAVAGGGSPFRGDPSFDEHALQGGIERAFFHLQHIVGGALDGVGNLVAVRFALQGEGLRINR